MLPALFRCLRRLFDPRPAARCSPLDEDEWDRIKREGAPTFPVVDRREPHLESTRRVDEEMGPLPLRGFSNGNGPQMVP